MHAIAMHYRLNLCVFSNGRNIFKTGFFKGKDIFSVRILARFYYIVLSEILQIHSEIFSIIST